MNSSLGSRQHDETELNTWRKVWEWWKRVALKIGSFQARLILTIFYYVLLAPFSLLVRLLDPLAINRNSRRAWLERENPDYDLLEQSRRQS